MNTTFSDDFADEPSVEERYCYCTTAELEAVNAEMNRLRRQDHAKELVRLTLALFDAKAVPTTATFNLGIPSSQ